MRFILLLGVVSLLADMTYEGARSITGPYLGLLGASAAVVGAVAGAGEMIGYVLRLASGYLTDRTRKYWTIAMLGYAVNLLAVPALALAGRWEVAALLIIAERPGKAIRAPARDVLLAERPRQWAPAGASASTRPWTRLAALTGPLVVAVVLATMQELSHELHGAARAGAGGALRSAGGAAPVSSAGASASRNGSQQPRSQAAALVLDLRGGLRSDRGRIRSTSRWRRIHWNKPGVASDTSIPLLYALAMGVEALTSLAFGNLFDRWGNPVLVAAPLAAAARGSAGFPGRLVLGPRGHGLLGGGMGVQSPCCGPRWPRWSPSGKRGSAYGIFNTVYGVCWFAGSALMGVLYQTSAFRLVVFSICAQLAAIPLLLLTSDVTARPDLL